MTPRKNKAQQGRNRVRGLCWERRSRSGEEAAHNSFTDRGRHAATVSKTSDLRLAAQAGC